MKKISIFACIVLTIASASAQSPTVSANDSSPVATGLTIGIMVDNSGSYRSIFDRVLASATAVIEGVREGDEAFLATFVDTPKIKLRQEMTREKRDLQDASDNMFIEGGPTALLDAVVFGSKYIAENGGNDPARARVLIIITDGDERQSSATLEDAIKLAKEAKARIFVLGLYEEKFYPKAVDRLVKETGGAKFVPKMPKDTPSAVASLLTAIRSK